MPESIQKDKPINILTLDGGGVRGLSSLLALQALMDRLNVPKVQSTLQPCHVFDLICGTSTGGLIAIMLGRLRMSVKDAIGCYRDLSKKVFERHATGQQKLDGFVPMYDASILEECVKELVAKASNKDANALLEDPLSDEAGLCRTFVVAVTQTYGDAPPKRFRSYTTDAGFADAYPIWKVARATAAMRPFFPSIAVGDPPVTYIDGAFSGANNPSELAIEEALDIFPDRPIGCLLSLGTGIPDAVSVTGDQAKISEAYQKLLHSCESVHNDVGKKSLRSQQPYFRFSVNRGLGNIAFEEWDREELTAITQRYMDGFKVEATAKRCVEALKPRAAEVRRIQLERESLL